jgi:hypothetical protein
MPERYGGLGHPGIPYYSNLISVERRQSINRNSDCIGFLGCPHARTDDGGSDTKLSLRNDPIQSVPKTTLISIVIREKKRGAGSRERWRHRYFSVTSQHPSEGTDPFCRCRLGSGAESGTISVQKFRLPSFTNCTVYRKK